MSKTNTMMIESLISIVIPVHNGARYLSEALESVRTQRGNDLQIIVVDDGSTDETARVAQSFSNIEYSFQAQSGAASARNKGVEKARGEYLAFLDADDIWMPDKLDAQLNVLQSRKADIVLGQVEQFLSPEIDAQTNRARVPDEIMPAFIPSAMLMRREDFLRVGFFETGWQVGEFIDWFARATEIGLTHFALPQVVLRRRIHATNQGVSKRQFQNDFVRIVKASLDRRRIMSNGATTNGATMSTRNIQTTVEVTP